MGCARAFLLTVRERRRMSSAGDIMSSCAWSRPAGRGWGEGSGAVAMDGAVVLALHSDMLFMEPLIAQAR